MLAYIIMPAFIKSFCTPKQASTQRARKFKKVQAKKLMQLNKSNFFFREIAVLNFFPVQKSDFWPFLKLQKMEFGQKFFREID